MFYFIAIRLLPRFDEHRHYRLFYNIYNSGIAIVTTGSLLKGILDIAGTASVYVPWFAAVGWICAAAGLAMFVIGHRQVLRCNGDN